MKMAKIKIPVAPRGGVFLMFIIPHNIVERHYPIVASDRVS